MGKIFPKDLIANFGLCNFFSILTLRLIFAETPFRMKKTLFVLILEQGLENNTQLGGGDVKNKQTLNCIHFCHTLSKWVT